jgi:general secretion pathway protein G
MSERSRRRERGLTFIEVLTVLTLMALLALVALPYMHHKYRSFKELELQRRLAMMRAAIDRYHEYAAAGQIEPWDLDWHMYPEDLESLVEGVEVRPAADEPPVVIRFLRRIPEDPFTGEATWDCRGYEDDPEERSSSCDDIYDVFSRSDDEALDGTNYSDW